MSRPRMVLGSVQIRGEGGVRTTESLAAKEQRYKQTASREAQSLKPAVATPERKKHKNWMKAYGIKPTQDFD